MPSHPPVQEWCANYGFNGASGSAAIPRKRLRTPWTLGHLRYVHGYDNVNPVGSVTVDGAYLKSCFDFKRVRRIAWV